MNNICSSDGKITDPAQLNEKYNATNFLPPAGTGRDPESGRLTNDSLNAMYETQTKNNIFISVQTYKQKLAIVGDTKTTRVAIKAALENLGQQDKEAMSMLQSQFCWNYWRYKYALEDLFTTLVNTSTAVEFNTEDRAKIQQKLNIAREFNTNLNDLIQFANHVAQMRAAEMGTQNGEINALNTRIREIYDRLASANDLLKREDATVELRKRMVEFTQEKNLSANNLLSLYGFLNLVALGLLFYISRS